MWRSASGTSNVKSVFWKPIYSILSSSNGISNKMSSHDYDGNPCKSIFWNSLSQSFEYGV